MRKLRRLYSEGLFIVGIFAGLAPFAFFRARHELIVFVPY